VLNFQSPVLLHPRAAVARPRCLGALKISIQQSRVLALTEVRKQENLNPAILSLHEHRRKVVWDEKVGLIVAQLLSESPKSV